MSYGARALRLCQACGGRAPSGADDVRNLSHKWVGWRPPDLAELEVAQPGQQKEAMTETTPSLLNNVVTIDDERIKSHLDRVVRGSVEETLNALLDAATHRSRCRRTAKIFYSRQDTCYPPDRIRRR